MSFPRYPSYKDSGVEWLGEVPGHWAVRRLKTIVSMPLQYGANELAEQSDRSLPRFIRITDIDDAGNLRDETFRSLPAEVALPYLLQDGDLLLARSGATVGKSFIYSEKWGVACFAGYLIRARLDQTSCLAKWLYLYCQSNDYWGYIVGTQIQSTIQNVSAEKYANLYLPLPSVLEQTQIAAFLDCETAKIDALVAEQRRLMELLKEKRQAVISHAVTKGLNPNAPMKPSGIEWLGDVPAHWDVRKLTSIAVLESGHTPSRQRPEYWIEEDCVIPWFTLADVGFLRDERNTLITGTSQKISQVGIKNSSARLLPTGTVLLSRTASLGFSGITTIPLAVSQDFAAWICGDAIESTYLLSCLRAMKSEFHRLMMGSTHQTIYMPDIEAFRVSVPPTAEQSEIAEHVNKMTCDFDALSAAAQRTIHLLQERRTALISAAVTGQIDVRHLPEDGAK